MRAHAVEQHVAIVGAAQHERGGADVEPGQLALREQVDRSEIGDPGWAVVGDVTRVGVDERARRRTVRDDPPGDLPVGVVALVAQGVDDLAVGVDDGRVRPGEVRGDLAVQVGEGVVRHRREEVVLEVVVHVQVEEPQHRVHVHGARVQPVVEDVLAQAGVLGRGEEPQHPGPVERRQPDEQEGDDRADRQRPHHDAAEDGEGRPRLPHHVTELVVGDEVASVVVDRPGGVAGHPPEHLRAVDEVEQVRQNRAPLERPRQQDLRVAPDDDRVGVVADVRPAPHRRLTQEHERREVVDRIVGPPGAERRPVAALVPA